VSHEKEGEKGHRRCEGKNERTKQRDRLLTEFRRRNDGLKASEYGLEGGVVLHLVLALRGGVY